jgi:hypothetical protein
MAGGAIVFLATVASAKGADTTAGRCTDLTRMVRSTYTFRPSKLTADEQKAKGQEMDQVWKLAEAHGRALGPCLRNLLEAPGADGFFRFDGASLLVKLDPAPASKALQVKLWSDAQLDDVDLRDWVETLARRGQEGFDVSRAGRRWLTEPGLRYSLTEHGGYEVTAYDGAVFLFGSMDEAAALPTLIDVARDPKHPGRLNALWLLMHQATPEALAALRTVPRDHLPPEPAAALAELLAERAPPAHRTIPGVSRAALLAAFAKRGEDDRADFDRLTAKPRFVEAAGQVLLPSDAPQVRLLRRKLVARCNQHGIDDYILLSSLLASLGPAPKPAGSTTSPRR